MLMACPSHTLAGGLLLWLSSFVHTVSGMISVHPAKLSFEVTSFLIIPEQFCDTGWNLLFVFLLLSLGFNC